MAEGVTDADADAGAAGEGEAAMAEGEAAALSLAAPPDWLDLVRELMAGGGKRNDTDAVNERRGK